jgi:hypothetical protein
MAYRQVGRLFVPAGVALGDARTELDVYSKAEMSNYVKYGSVLPTFPTISNHKVWLDAALSTVTIAAQDKRVSSVTDLTGNGFTATQTTAAKRPKWLPSGFNNRFPCFYFDGAASALVIALGTIAQPFTIVSVIENYQGGTLNDNLYRDGAGGGAVGYISGGNGWAIYAGTELKSTALFDQNRAFLRIGTNANAAVRIDVFNGNNSLISNNGVETAAAAAGAGGITTQLFVGSDGSTSWAKVYLRSFHFFDKALSAGERTSINTYYDAAAGCGL